MSKKMCSPYCMFFNQEPKEVKETYIDKDGLKHRVAVFVCNYTGNEITKFKKCSLYRTDKVDV